MSTFNITGIDAESKKNRTVFAALRPSGAVRLQEEPDNEYDPYCVSVWFADVKLGYLPANKNSDGDYIGSDIQKLVISSGITAAHIERYAYKDGNSFNEDHNGLLGSVTLSLDFPDNDSGRIFGGNYLRVTQFISYFSPYGGSDGLIKWAFNQGTTFEQYKDALNKTAESGTLMHDCIEKWLGGHRDQDILDGLPAGWGAFTKKYDLEPCYMEERFFDNTLMVTGQPDFVGFCNGKLMVLDWKSSTKPSMKHELQLAIYAKNAHFDGEKAQEAMVVCFGSDNKQGFATRTIKRDKIERMYSAMQLLKQMMELCGCYVREHWNDGGND